MEKFDVIIPVLYDDLKIVMDYYPLFKKNLPIKKIILVGNDKVKNELENDNRFFFINEDKIYKGMTLDSIRESLRNLGDSEKRGGWYFQQFIKMAYAYICEGEYYIVWDSDTIPLKEITFKDKSSDICFFNIKNEYNKPYFTTINTLFQCDLEKVIEGSFITEHMIFNCTIMKELIEKINSNQKIKGNSFWEKVLNAININDISGSGFSEFETYGNYYYKYYPEKFQIRKLKTIRYGKVLFGEKPTNQQLEWVAKKYDTISFEKSHLRSRFYQIWSNNFFYKIIPFECFEKFLNGIKKIKHKKHTF